MTKAQFEEFVTFFKQDIHYGADIFLWKPSGNTNDIKLQIYQHVQCITTWT